MIKRLTDIIQGKTPFKNKRSSKWNWVRKQHLKKFPLCAVCNGKNKLEVHHIKPYHEYPELELNTDNLITLCESKSYGVICHLFFGHLGNYKKINPNVIKDINIWNNKLKQSFY